MAIVGKHSDLGLAEAMNAKYKLEKRKRGYAIASIKDQGVRVATQVLADKLMRKHRANEVPSSVIVLTEQCAEGVQFLCDEFLTNCKQAQEQGNTFHYAWLLLSILLIVGDLLVEIQFLTTEGDLPEAARYTSLWAIKYTNRIHEIKVFWVFVEASIRTWINRRPCLSPIVYNILKSMAEFKADMHNLYIWVHKNLAPNVGEAFIHCNRCCNLRCDGIMVSKVACSGLGETREDRSAVTKEGHQAIPRAAG